MDNKTPFMDIIIFLLLMFTLSLGVAEMISMFFRSKL